MGQFSKYIEHAEPPPVVVRAFCIVAPVLNVIQAVGSRRLGDSLTAAWFVALFLPWGIAPKFTRARLAALERHPVLGFTFMGFFFVCGSFVLLIEFFSRTTSAFIAIPLAVVLTAASLIVRRSRTTNSPDQTGPGSSS